MSDSPALDPKKIFKIYAGSTELSPFHECYATSDMVLRFAAGRFFAHDNGDDHIEAYWALRQQAVLYDVPERPLEICGPDAVDFLELVFARRIDNLKIGRGRYVIACTNNGGLFIDGILFRLADTRFWFVHPDGDMNTWFLAHSPGFNVTVTDPQSRVLQIQGPKSFDVMHAAGKRSVSTLLVTVRAVSSIRVPARQSSRTGTPLTLKTLVFWKECKEAACPTALTAAYCLPTGILCSSTLPV